jgi:DNA repair protein RecO (recombination protein O)
MNLHRTRGIVLEIGGFGEADKLVKFYSPDIGRATAIAKSAKRSQKRFVNKLEPFSILEIEYVPPRSGSLFLLREAELSCAFLRLRQDVGRYTCASVICELTLLFTREMDPDPDIFTLLTWAFQRLSNRNNVLQTMVFFFLKLLDTCGYRPELSCCSTCGAVIKPANNHYLNVGNSNLICSDCRQHITRSSRKLSGQTLAFLLHSQRLDLNRLDRLQIQEKNCKEALRFLYSYSLRILQRDINSWPQLCKMMHLPAS